MRETTKGAKPMTEDHVSRLSAIELTAADRVKWRHMDNDGGRRAMKYVSLQESARLKVCVAFDPAGIFDFAAEPFKQFFSEFDIGTNPSWLAARIAEELYERAVIDERELDRIMDVS